MSQVIATEEGQKPVLLVIAPVVVMFLLFVSAQPLPAPRNRASSTAAGTHQPVAP